MNIAYVGQFEAPHSTENEVAKALRKLGCNVIERQENQPAVWRGLAEGDMLEGVDMLLWTRTGWDWPRYGITQAEAHRLQRATLLKAASMNIPTVGYHLDIWWGLRREAEVWTEPFFRVALLATADGGHDPEWAAAGVKHVWFPPGVSEFECEPGTYREEYASDLAFVGSWQGGYHPEHAHRQQLVDFLRDTYGDRCRFWPKPGEHAVRGEALRDLYASVKVLVGDSCLVPHKDGRPLEKYVSDRTMESTGRGGFLIHPAVEGVTDGSLLTDGKHLVTWPLGNFTALKERIDYYLDPAHEGERVRIAAQGRAHVMETATYTVRMQTLLDLLVEKGYLAGQ